MCACTKDPKLGALIVPVCIHVYMSKDMKERIVHREKTSSFDKMKVKKTRICFIFHSEQSAFVQNR